MAEPMHGCPGCGTQVRRSMLACRTCWALLPADVRDRVTRAWRALRGDRTNQELRATHRRAVIAVLTWYRGRRSGATP